MNVCSRVLAIYLLGAFMLSVFAQQKYHTVTEKKWSPYYINIISVGAFGETPAPAGGVREVDLNTTRMDILMLRMNHVNIGAVSLFNMVGVTLDSLTRQPLYPRRDITKNFFDYEVGYWVPIGINLPLLTRKDHYFSLNADAYLLPFDPGSDSDNSDGTSNLKGSITYPRLLEVDLRSSGYGFSMAAGYRYQIGDFTWQPPAELAGTFGPQKIGDLTAWFLEVSVGLMWPSHKMRQVTRQAKAPNPSLNIAVDFPQNSKTFLAGERKTLMVTVENDGKGAAEKVVMELHSDSPDLSYLNEHELGNIASKSQTRIGVPITVSDELAKPYETTLEFICRDKDGFTAKKKVDIRLQPRALEVDANIPRSRNRNPESYAIILGIENYRNLPDAPSAVNDARIFKEYAVNVLGVPDDNYHIFLGINDQVTLGQLKVLFDSNGWLARRVQPTSDVYVFFAGHGVPSVSDMSAFLLPFDGNPDYPEQTGYSVQQLQASLEALNVRAVNIFLDACFSGATRENIPLIAARSVSVNYLQPGTTSDRVVMFTASAGNQISSVYAKKNHGLFTYFLLRGLRGEADLNRDGALTVRELESYLRQYVPRAAANMDREQTPEVIGRSRERVLVEY